MSAQTIRQFWADQTQNLLFKSSGRPALNFSQLQAAPELLKAIITCYQKVFAGPPWYETHQFEAVERHMSTEIGMDGRCSFIQKNDIVTGFTWGKCLNSPKVYDAYAAKHLKNASAETMAALEISLKDLPVACYVYELGTLVTALASMAAIRTLMMPLLEHSLERYGCRGMLYWTAKAAASWKLAEVIGCEIVHSLKDDSGCEIIFCYLPDFIPVLKAYQNLSGRQFTVLTLKAMVLSGLAT